MKTVFITGATSGIGLQLAKDYSNAGWKVIACGRNPSRLGALSSYSSSIHTVQFDITDLNQAKDVLRDLPVIPQLWILNAGDCEYVDDGVVDAALIARVMSTNVIGLANSIESIQHHLQRSHKVVIVGSIASEVALPRAEAYGASKAAVSYFARALKLDLKEKGIQVSVVYPGFVKTPLTDKNTFPMPMMISVEEASETIRKSIQKGKSFIYFPFWFTSILRLIGLMPYRWQLAIASKLTN